MLPWDLQSPPRSVPNPSKIEPGAAQDAQKRTKGDDKHSQTREKRLRNAQKQKKVPKRVFLIESDGIRKAALEEQSSTA